MIMDNNIDNNIDKDNINNMDLMDALKEYSQTALYDETNIKKTYGGTDVLIANLPNIFNMIVQGETVTSICKTLGISRGTWYNLSRENQHFQAMIKAAELEQISNIKKSLINKCNDRYVIKSKVLPNGKIIEYEEFIPSDTNAIKFYLLNKASDEFKEKQEVSIKQTNIVIDIIEDDIIDI